MGAWGTGIFEDDVACDVRDDFKELIAEGVSVLEATQRLMKQYDLEDPDDGPTFWLALAAIQLELGRVQDSVKNEALRVIDEGTDLARWQEEASPQDAESRRVALEGLRKKLFATQTQPKPVRPHQVGAAQGLLCRPPAFPECYLYGHN